MQCRFYPQSKYASTLLPWNTCPTLSVCFLFEKESSIFGVFCYPSLLVVILLPTATLLTATLLPYYCYIVTLLLLHCFPITATLLPYYCYSVTLVTLLHYYCYTATPLLSISVPDPHSTMPFLSQKKKIKLMLSNIKGKGLCWKERQHGQFVLFSWRSMGRHA